MKASELKPGMEIDGWTVVSRDAAISVPRTDGALYVTPDIFLLELELMGDVLHEGEDSTIQEVKRARTWYRADEEVEVMR